jgi:predicted phage terminase large subunit-like protein
MKDELLELMANMTDAQLSAVIETLPSDQKEHLSIIAQEYGEALKRERGQKHFMDFVKIMWPNFVGGRHHGIMANAFERVARGELKRLIINMPPRHRLSLDTPIPTTAGWKTIESVAVGDFVFAPDGSPVEVTGKSEVFTELLYEVTTSDGQTIECDGEHLWTVRFGSSRPYETLSTAEILRKLNTESWRTLGNLPMLPRQAAAQYPHADLPIDPYVLGVWLGDGSSGSSSVGCAYADLSQMQSQVEACGYSVTHNPKFQQFNILGLLSQLRELGVLNNKHIPEQYLCASIEQRMALLQGLIDTDGDVTKDGKVTFNQTNLELTKQVLCLIHSLGVKARITHRQTSCKGMPSKPSHRIMFKLANAARIPRKAVRCKAPEGNWSRSIDVKQTTKTGQVQCLEVANPDGLFMAGRGWVVTHNTKSEFASYLLPAWFLGNFPHKKIIQASNTAELAVGFGRKIRNLVDGEVYSKVFPNVALRSDSKAAGRWSTNSNGEYFAIGVGGTVTGKGADLLIIDDPHSEQEAKLAESDPTVFDSVYEWYTSGPRQRLQPGGSIVIVQTRWSKRDLTGRVLKDSAQRGGDEWEVIEFPAILPSDKPLWPEFWTYKELDALRTELPNAKWQAQYQQNPTSEGGAIVKREWWKRWEKDDPPPCEFIIQSWDTAFLKSERADYSACTTWGVFSNIDETGKSQSNIILLNAFKKRMEFPELKQRAYQEFKEWEVDSLIVEAKAAGSPLIFELRAMGIPVQEFSPTKGNDKIARLNAVADIFASGMVWVPNTNWAEELIEEVASFPAGDHDDLVDSMTQALLRYRKGGFIRLASDEEDEPVYRQNRSYY